MFQCKMAMGRNVLLAFIVSILHCNVSGFSLYHGMESFPVEMSEIMEPEGEDLMRCFETYERMESSSSGPQPMSFFMSGTEECATYFYMCLFLDMDPRVIRVECPFTLFWNDEKQTCTRHLQVPACERQARGEVTGDVKTKKEDNIEGESDHGDGEDVLEVQSDDSEHNIEDIEGIPEAKTELDSGDSIKERKEVDKSGVEKDNDDQESTDETESVEQESTEHKSEHVESEEESKKDDEAVVEKDNDDQEGSDEAGPVEEESTAHKGEPVESQDETSQPVVSEDETSEPVESEDEISEPVESEDETSEKISVEEQDTVAGTETDGSDVSTDTDDTEEIVERVGEPEKKQLPIENKESDLSS